MSGTKGAWTLERRAKQAARMRGYLADPVFMAKRAARIAASLKAAAARRANMLKIANDPAMQAKCKAWRLTDEGKAAAARGGKASIEKRRTDPDTKARHQVRTARANRTKEKRLASSAQLKKLWCDPEFIGRQTLRAIHLSRQPDTMTKAWATRRAGKVPKGKRKRYVQLRDMIGAEAAMKIVHREARVASGASQ